MGLQNSAQIDPGRQKNGPGRLQEAVFMSEPSQNRIFPLFGPQDGLQNRSPEASKTRPGALREAFPNACVFRGRLEPLFDSL